VEKLNLKFEGDIDEKLKNLKPEVFKGFLGETLARRRKNGNKTTFTLGF